MSIKYLNRFGEGSTEHESLSLAGNTHFVISNYSSDILLETHVQHPVSFIEY